MARRADHVAEWHALPRRAPIAKSLMPSPHGKGVMEYSDGTVYDGEFKQGRLDGPGVLKRVDGEVRTGTFVDAAQNLANPIGPVSFVQATQRPRDAGRAVARGTGYAEGGAGRSWPTC